MWRYLLSLAARTTIVTAGALCVYGLATAPDRQVPDGWHVVAERPCEGAEITTLPAHVVVNGTRVTLYCGDRYVVTGPDRCFVQRGAEYTRVRCTER